MRLFDRDRDGHPWEKAFEEMRLPDPGRRWAVAANWKMDHRVSKDRETGDLQASGHFSGVADVEDWWAARGLYFREEICRPAAGASDRETSAYSRRTNSSNLIPARVAGFDELVHVSSLNALARWISRRDTAADVEISLRALAGRGLPVKAPGMAAANWFDEQVSDLARTLSTRGEEAVRQAAGLLADATGAGEPPWWATFSEEIRTALDSEDAARICAALGLGHRTSGEWLVVWRYPVQEILPLYRPTAIEANDSPYHFPSPPEQPFGITMPLDPSFAACREVLHRPLRGAAARERCTGKLLYLEDFSAIGDNEALLALRAGHRERLRREFGETGLEAWLNRHPDPR
jgi:hypothetical protein